MKNSNKQLKRGMTAIELVIVTGIFSIVASVAFLNYGKFQDRVEIRNLSNQIALKVVEAQKSAIGGKWHSSAGASWKPAYGVVFNTSAPTQFVYFADLNNSDTCNNSSGAACNPPYTVGGEIQSIVTITGGSTVSSIVPTGSGCPASITSLTVVFRRPNTSPIQMHACNPFDVSVNLSGPQSLTGRVRIYSSGRLSMN